MPPVLASILKSQVVRAVAIVAGLVGLYALLGFKLAPGIVRDLALPDVDGAPMLGFERLFVDFELASLWQRSLVFWEMTLEAPNLRTVVRPDGRVNLADLALPKVPEDEDEELPSLWLQALAVDRGVIELIDQSRRDVFARRFERVAFALEDFRTTPEGGDFRFSARGQSAETIDWKGNFTLEPVIAS